MEAALAARISKLKTDFRATFADCADDFDELHRLRYDVFCAQRKILNGANGIESDVYDRTSRHVILRRHDGEMVGTVRLVLPIRGRLEQSFPMQRVCDPTILSQLPLDTTGEISRFCLSRDRRDSAEHADAVLRLGLMKGILQASNEAGLTHWCAVMEKGLLRLLQLAAIWFEPVGPQIEYFGTRQPAVASIGSVLTRGQHERRPIWDYVTGSDPVPPTISVAASPGRMRAPRHEAASISIAPTASSSDHGTGLHLPVFNRKAFERTAAFLTSQVLTSHLQTLAERGQELLDGLQSVGPQSAAEDSLASASHTIGGSAGMFGFERLAAIAGRFDYAYQFEKAEVAGLRLALASAIEASLQELQRGGLLESALSGGLSYLRASDVPSQLEALPEV
jgi:N-acyl amino acid synthase of PEP-CTERM/exosortase system